MSFLRFWNYSVICGLQPNLAWILGSLDNYLLVPLSPFEKVPKDLQHPRKLWTCVLVTPKHLSVIIKCMLLLAGYVLTNQQHFTDNLGFAGILPWKCHSLQAHCMWCISWQDPYSNWQAIELMKNILMLLFWMQCKSSHISAQKNAEGEEELIA